MKKLIQLCHCERNEVKRSNLEFAGYMRLLRRVAPRFGPAPSRDERLRTDIWIFLLLTIILSACTSSGSSPTPVIAFDNGGQEKVGVEASTSTPPPLRFDLPTPGAEPVSGWRPPLYPIPWAVSPFDHFYFARPISADNVNWPLAQYRYGGIFFDNVVHSGVDIPDDKGTPILAAGPGTVIWAGWGLFTEAPLNTDDPYGQAVAIRHDFGYRGQQLFTVYAHMEAVNVSYGQWVNTGDVIGYVGDTGQTTGPHLHFEVRLGENTFHHTYNPELWMSPPQGWGILVGRILDEDGEELREYRVEIRPEPDGKPLRTVLTYGGGAINPDPYYKENMALSDLPAGIYKVSLKYDDTNWQYWVEIFPGQVTYFTFHAEDGFSMNPIPTPKLKFIPPTPTIPVEPEVPPPIE
jgi:murein DD-endopeptidase MepM/ murein hydrolase activator NlpD